MVWKDFSYLPTACVDLAVWAQGTGEGKHPSPGFCQLQKGTAAPIHPVTRAEAADVMIIYFSSWWMAVSQGPTPASHPCGVCDRVCVDLVLASLSGKAQERGWKGLS